MDPQPVDGAYRVVRLWRTKCFRVDADRRTGQEAAPVGGPGRAAAGFPEGGPGGNGADEIPRDPVVLGDFREASGTLVRSDAPHHEPRPALPCRGVNHFHCSCRKVWQYNRG